MQHHSPHPHEEQGADVSPKTLAILERLDSLAHVVVAVFFLLMATGVMIEAGVMFVKQLHLIGAEPPPLAQSTTPVAKSEPSAPANPPTRPGSSPGPSAPVTSEGNGHPAPAPPAGETDQKSDKGTDQKSGKPNDKEGADKKSDKEETDKQSDKKLTEAQKIEERKQKHPYIYESLELLSTLLFAVIILELLRTIITYLQTRNTQEIMKEFLIVGIISSIRKILMVGAESSISATEGMDFIQESIGVVLSVVAILLMIGGLILLRRSYATHPDANPTPEREE